MFTSRRNAVVAVAVAIAVGLGVFAVIWLTKSKPDTATNQHVVQPGPPGQTGRTLSPQEVANLSAPPHKPADTAFFQGMIHHHAQALEMTALIAERTQNPDLALLAKRITISQQDEIELMRRWLTDRGETPPQGHAGHGDLMPGMLTTQQLAELTAARGAAFDRLFLEFMIRHHEGALVMVQRLYAAGGGVEPASDRFARDVNADQSIEIRRMQDMLAKLA